MGWIRAFAVGLAAAACPSAAWAGGFYVPEIGPRAVGMSGAMVAQQNDTTAIFHNPAALGGLPGTQIQAAGNLFFGNVEFFRRPFDDPTTGESLRFAGARNTNRVGGAPYIGVVSDVTVPNLALGLGVYVPFGAHLVFPRDGAQRHIVTEVNFRTIYVTPTVAYKAWDRLSIGVGLSYIFSDIALDQVNAVPFITGDPEVSPNPSPEIEGLTQLRGKDTASFGANLGVLYTDPADRFGLGVSVMVPTRLKFKGDVRVDNDAVSLLIDPETGEELQPQGRRDDRFGLEYPLPLIVRGGVMVRPHPFVTLETDINWQRWETFDQLRVEFDNNYELLPTPGAFMADVVIDQKWRNTLSVRFGADVTPVDPERIPLHLRAGVLFDQSPIDDRYFDVLAPDSDKVGVSAGVGYTFRLGRRVQLDADIGFMHLFFKQRTISPVTVGAPLSGNDDDATTTNDSQPNDQQIEIPGSDKTILNKPAPSFYHGVTRTFFDILGFGVALRI